MVANPPFATISDEVFVRIVNQDAKDSLHRRSKEWIALPLLLRGLGWVWVHACRNMPRSFRNVAT
jgi:hypothetical protein